MKASLSLFPKPLSLISLTTGVTPSAVNVVSMSTVSPNIVFDVAVVLFQLSLPYSVGNAVGSLGVA